MQVITLAVARVYAWEGVIWLCEVVAAFRFLSESNLLFPFQTFVCSVRVKVGMFLYFLCSTPPLHSAIAPWDPICSLLLAISLSIVHDLTIVVPPLPLHPTCSFSTLFSALSDFMKSDVEQIIILRCS